MSGSTELLREGRYPIKIVVGAMMRLLVFENWQKLGVIALD